MDGPCHSPPGNRLPDERPLIIGHRGAGLPSTQSKQLIGNSRRAIKSAIEAKADWIEKAGIPGQQIIIFGDHKVRQEYRDKGFRLGYTTLYSKHRGMILSPSVVIQRCRDFSYDLLVVPIIFVTPRLIAAARENQLEVWSYDSNDPRDLQYCAECGVRGLIVETPGAAMAQFRD